MSNAGDGQGGSSDREGEASRPAQPGLGEPAAALAATHPAAPFLRYRDPSQALITYALQGQRAITIGRTADADLSLAWDPSVSSVHAQLEPLGSHWLISDDGLSRNGTFVNGQRLGARRRLRDGDVVRVGVTTLSFHDPGTEKRTTTTISDSRGLTGIVTLLFTDLAGSTELLARLGDEAGDRVRQEHFALLRKAAGEHGGEEVKTLGDGLMVAFGSALAAVACAASMQRRIAEQPEHTAGRPLGLRIGLNAGEVIISEDDYFGTPVIVAKRLCDQAGPGTTLVSEVVRSLVGARPGYSFTPVGALSLKGLTEPVAAFELRPHALPFPGG
jgi:class 3 adenylate cyclase